MRKGKRGEMGRGREGERGTEEEERWGSRLIYIMSWNDVATESFAFCHNTTNSA